MIHIGVGVELHRNKTTTLPTYTVAGVDEQAGVSTSTLLTGTLQYTNNRLAGASTL